MICGWQDLRIEVVQQEIEYLNLNGDIMVKKGIFGLWGNTHILVSYTLISSQEIKGLEGWNHGYVNH